MEVRAVAYANYPNVALHRAVMRALLDNRARGARLRLSLTEIVAAVERLGVPATPEQVSGSLRELEELKVVDSMQSFERVRTAAELRLNHFSYDVTGLGERIEQFFDELAGLVEAVGSLDANRLARIRALLGRLTEHASLDPRELQSTFTELHAQFEDLRAGAAQFMRELSATMASTEAIDEATFADYKRKVADYLSGFWRELGQHADAITAHVTALDASREPMLRAVASLSVAPHPALSSEEVLERQVAILRRQWAEISAWFGAGDSQLRSLDTHLHAAIDWILRGVRRLRERRVQRVNRSSEYRALAALFASSAEEDCHAVFAAAFGLYGARHMAVPELDPDVVSPGESWWDAPFAPVQGFLRRPGRGEVTAGRPAPIVDATEAHALALEEELRRRAVVSELLDRLPEVPARLSELPALDEESFDVLLDALGMAVATGKVGYSDDGTLALEVLDMGDSLPVAAVRVGDGGVLESPDLLVQVSRAGVRG
ncbi:TIGR02677 family protein [Solirubrobacter soli]|uniref:TIGR02677 family protein n=1 Tax=Solirubrobacter soli TaxID=363832 RepID=UPI00055C4299|nr:TIGR02677 family protein [Solirubrobacter soli]